MPPMGVANFVVGGGANPDKPPPRGASTELARDGGRTSDILKTGVTAACRRRYVAFVELGEQVKDDLGAPWAILAARNG